MQKDTLRQMNLSIEGRGYAGVIDELTLPKLGIKTEEYRAGGMDLPIEIDMGMEKMEVTYSLSKFDKNNLTTFGLKAGSLVPLVIRASVLQEEDGVEIPLKINFRGMVKEMDFGTWKAGDTTPVKVMVAVRYYRFELDGEVIHEIDPPNLIRVIDGVDQMEQTRRNIGL